QDHVDEAQPSPEIQAKIARARGARQRRRSRHVSTAGSLGRRERNAGAVGMDGCRMNSDRGTNSSTRSVRTPYRVGPYRSRLQNHREVRLKFFILTAFVL